MTKEPNIRISPGHGLNPAIPRCYFCGERKNEVVLVGRMKGDVEAPKDSVWDMSPCDECAGWMKQGIILISVLDSYKEGDNNPYRTGGWSVINESALERIVTDPALMQSISKARFCFVPDEVWDKIGIPRE